jgi:ribose transport system substrate-binding protein
MKKVVAILLVVAMIGLMAACAAPATPAASSAAPASSAPAAPSEAPAVSSEAPAASSEAPAASSPAAAVDLKGKKLGFINAGPDDYYAQFGNALKAMAGVYGIEVTELNSDYKPEKELANCQDLIAKGVDAIAVITAGAAGSAATIKAANDAKVPIFFIAGKPATQTGSDYQGWVSDNFVIMGYTIGKWVAEKYPDAKDKIVNIPGFLGQGPAEGELVGFQLALDEAKMGTAFLTKSSEWQRTLAIPITQDLVASGRDFKVVFACNEETAAGVIQVFEEQNVKDKIIVSNNGKEEAWEWMKQGKMSATVPNPPSLNADLCMQQIVRQLSGQKFEKDLQIMPWAVLTKDNVDQAIPWKIETYLTGRAANKFKYDLAYYEEQYVKNKQMFADFDAKLAAYMAKK